MSDRLNKIIKELTKELRSEITIMVRTELRTSLVSDITTIVKECLNNDELHNTKNSGGWITIDDCAEKYHISTRAVGSKIKQFNISRKKIGRHKLLNELEFLTAHDRPMEKPKFLKRQKAA